MNVINEAASRSIHAIFWDWNGRQPPIFRRGSQPQVIVSYGYNPVVESIAIETTLPIGYANLLLGGTVYMDSGLASATLDSAFVSAAYLHSGILIWATVHCPVTKDQFWSSPMMIEFSSTLTSARRSDGIHHFC